MTAVPIETLLRSFRRQVIAIRAVRVLLALVFVAALVWASELPSPGGRRVMFLLGMAGVVVWLWIILGAVRLTREVQAGNILLATGQLDRAEQWLRQSLSRSTLSVQAKILAVQQLASLAFRRDAHQDVVTICRELLRHRLSGVRNLWMLVRLMLADSLLMLGRVAEAYEAMRPIYDVPLSIADRMRLLPIQLRYELAADHPASAVSSLAEKVQIAELMDAERAGLVHALLAEACRRAAMEPERQFLAERARLYCDLAPLAERYPMIAGVAGEEK